MIDLNITTQADEACPTEGAVMTAPNGSDHRVWLDLLAAMILPLIELFEILWDGLNAYQELTASIPMPSLHIVWTASLKDLCLHLHARGIRNARPTGDPTDMRIFVLDIAWRH